MKQIKPIFLDIDGVVNSTRSTFVKVGPVAGDSHPVIGPIPYTSAFALRCVDPICVELINLLIESDPQVAVVLSSTHRKSFAHGDYGSQNHLDRLRTFLTEMGFRLPAYFDVTPVLHRPRGEEVKQYLDSLDEAGKFQVIDYVILDDGKDFLDYQPLVHIDAAIGMDFPNYADACKYLAVPAPG